MPWKGVTVSEQRQRFLEDYQLNYYSISELAERFGISRKTAHMNLHLNLVTDFDPPDSIRNKIEMEIHMADWLYGPSPYQRPRDLLHELVQEVVGEMNRSGT